MRVPESVTPAWLEAMVPDLDDEEFGVLLAVLRQRGWSEADLQAGVVALRAGGKTPLAQRSVATRGETVIEQAAKGEETTIEQRAETPRETTIEREAAARGETTIEERGGGAMEGSEGGDTLARSGSSGVAGPVAVGTRFAPGASFAGFVIEGVAGRGGMGVVYRARQLRPARTVALKVMSSELVEDEGFRERFERETEISASIEHSNVIPIYGAGTEEGLLFIAMRYVQGTDLQAAMARSGALEPRRAVGIVAQVTAALDAAHAHGLVHRDVKPANVLLAREGALEHVYLTDFGLAKSLAAGGVTQIGMFVGTIDYAAPEQFEGGPIDARTDVYATGCMLYHVLTGTVPFPAASEAGKMRAHLDDAPPSPRSVDPNLPVELERVTRRAMAKNPDDRYPSAGDLGRAALAAVEGKPMTTQVERSVATGEAAHGRALAPTDQNTPTAGGSAPQSAPGLPRWLKLGVPALALAIGVVATVLLNSGGTHRIPTAGAPTRQSVEVCIQAHNMVSPSQKRPTQSGESELQRPPGTDVIFDQRSYVSCTSPPAPGANPDGYRAIAVTEVTGPGESVASGTDLADRIEASCETLELSYSFGSQQSFSRIPPFRVNTGEVWQYRPNASGGSVFAQASPIGLKLPFFPTRHEADVLHSDVTTLDDVTCVK